MSTNFQHVLVQRDQAVLTITMNRPQVLNAINQPMLQELIAAAEAAAQDNEIRCVVLTGAGRAFGSGQDLSEFAAITAKGELIDARAHLRQYHQLVQLLHTMPKPVIAALHGIATGISLNIALACDLRIAADNARFSEAFARIGLVPDGGGAYFLPRLIGMAKALEMALLMEEIDAAQAERLGLVTKVVPLAEFEQATTALARRCAEGPTQTYALIKELFAAAPASDLPTIFELEAKLQERALQTADHREGVSAFVQKRPPRYPGK